MTACSCSWVVNRLTGALSATCGHRHRCRNLGRRFALLTCATPTAWRWVLPKTARMNVPERNWMRTLSVAKRPDKSLVVGLDIGTSKIVAIVGEVHEDGQVEVISLGSHPSRGLKRGVVVDIESTEQSIQRAVEEAELMPIARSTRFLPALPAATSARSTRMVRWPFATAR